MNHSATRGFALLLLLTLGARPGAAEQAAGRVTALVPAALRNSVAAQPREELQWNDLLATDKSGRLRASLSDGSVLSLGATSELRVAKHDAASEQTLLELAYGRLRSMVAPRRSISGTFDVRTKTANVGVIGTDFFLDAAASGSLRVLCFSGSVTVTWRAEPSRTQRVAAGQVLELDAAGRGAVRRATDAEVRAALDSTAIAGVLDLAPRTRLTASLTRALDESKARPGDRVVARLTKDVRIAGVTVVPKGAELHGKVTRVQKRDPAHPMAEVAVSFERLRLKDGREFAFRSVIDGFEVARGLDMDDASPAETGLGASRPERVQTRLPAVRSAPRPPARVAEDTVASPIRDTTSPEPVFNAGADVRMPDFNLPVVQPQPAEGGSGALFKTSQGLRIPSGTTLVMRTLEP